MFFFSYDSEQQNPYPFFFFSTLPSVCHLTPSILLEQNPVTLIQCYSLAPKLFYFGSLDDKHVVITTQSIHTQHVSLSSGSDVFFLLSLSQKTYSTVNTPGTMTRQCSTWSPHTTKLLNIFPWTKISSSYQLFKINFQFPFINFHGMH